MYVCVYRLFICMQHRKTQELDQEGQNVPETRINHRGNVLRFKTQIHPTTRSTPLPGVRLGQHQGAMQMLAVQTHHPGL